MFVSIVTTLTLLSIPIHSAPPENAIEFPHEFAHVFDRMIKEGLRQSRAFKSSSVYYAYEDIKENGINEIGKRNKVTAKAKEYQAEILKNEEVAANRTNALYPIAPVTEWALFLNSSCLALQKILENNISGIRLETAGRPSTIIKQNTELKLSQDQKAAFLAAQLVIASNIYDLYRHDRYAFNVMHAKWSEDELDKSGEC